MICTIRLLLGGKKVRFNGCVEVLEIPANDGEGRTVKNSVKAQHPKRFRADVKADAEEDDERDAATGAGPSMGQGHSLSPWAQREPEYHYIGSKRGSPASSHESSPASSDTERKKRACDRDASVAQSSVQQGVPRTPMPKRAPPPPPDSVWWIDDIALTLDELDNGVHWEKLKTSGHVWFLISDRSVWAFVPPRSFGWAGSPRYLLFGSVGGCVRYVREDLTRSRQIRTYQDPPSQGKMLRTAKGSLVRSFLFPGYHDKRDHEVYWIDDRVNYRNYLDHAFLMANKVFDPDDEQFPEVFLATEGRDEEGHFLEGVPTWRRVVPPGGATGASSSSAPPPGKVFTPTPAAAAPPPKQPPVAGYSQDAMPPPKAPPMKASPSPLPQKAPPAKRESSAGQAVPPSKKAPPPPVPQPQGPVQQVPVQVHVDEVTSAAAVPEEDIPTIRCEEYLDPTWKYGMFRLDKNIHNILYWYHYGILKAYVTHFHKNWPQRPTCEGLLIERILSCGHKLDCSIRFSEYRDEYGDRPPKVVMFDSLTDVDWIIMQEVHPRVRNEREWAWGNMSGYLELLYHLAGRYGKYLYEYHCVKQYNEANKDSGHPLMSRPSEVHFSVDEQRVISMFFEEGKKDQTFRDFSWAFAMGMKFAAYAWHQDAFAAQRGERHWYDASAVMRQNASPWCTFLYLKYQCVMQTADTQQEHDLWMSRTIAKELWKFWAKKEFGPITPDIDTPVSTRCPVSRTCHKVWHSGFRVFLSGGNSTRFLAANCTSGCQEHEVAVQCPWLV